MGKETQQRLIDALQLLKEPKGSTIPSIVRTVNEEKPKISLKNIIQELSGCVKSGIMTQRNGRIRLRQTDFGMKSPSFRGTKAVAFFPGKNPEPKSPSQTSLCAKPKSPKPKGSKPKGRCPKAKPRCPRPKPRCPRPRSRRARSSRSRPRCRKQGMRKGSRSKPRYSRRRPRCPKLKTKKCSFIGE